MIRPRRADREAAPGANPLAVSPVLELAASGNRYLNRCAWGRHIPSVGCRSMHSPSGVRIVGLSPAAWTTS